MTHDEGRRAAAAAGRHLDRRDEIAREVTSLAVDVPVVDVDAVEAGVHERALAEARLGPAAYVALNARVVDGEHRLVLRGADGVDVERAAVVRLAARAVKTRAVLGRFEQPLALAVGTR